VVTVVAVATVVTTVVCCAVSVVVAEAGYTILDLRFSSLAARRVCETPTQ